MNTLILSRLQFGFTIGFHFLFPPISIGLAWFLVVVEAYMLWQRRAGGALTRTSGGAGTPGGTGTAGAGPDFAPLAKLFGRILAITFAIGVATGIVMSFQFGTNWASFARSVNDVFGTFLLAEVLFAFFAESSFLAIYLFGGKRVAPWLHLVSIIVVAVAATISAFWILVSNSWMQTPAGFTVDAGRIRLTSFSQAVFNPSMWIRFFHTVTSALLTAAFLVAGTCAYAILKAKGAANGQGGGAGTASPAGAAASGGARASSGAGVASAAAPTAGAAARRLLAASVIAGLVFSVAQIFPFGHAQAVEVGINQPLKLAAFEGLYETQSHAPLLVFGLPLKDPPYTTARVEIPNLMSWLFDYKGDYVIKGLKDFPPADYPPLYVIFFSFHWMFTLGVGFCALMGLSVLLLILRVLERARWLLWLLIVAIPFPLLCIQFGWITTEVGRQPWLVYQVLRTADAASATVSRGELLLSLALFGAVYLGLGCVYAVLLVRAIRQAPAVSGGK